MLANINYTELSSGGGVIGLRGIRISGHHRLRVIERQSRVDARCGCPSANVLVPAKVQDDILSDITYRTTIHG